MATFALFLTFFLQAIEPCNIQLRLLVGSLLPSGKSVDISIDQGLAEPKWEQIG